MILTRLWRGVQVIGLITLSQEVLQPQTVSRLRCLNRSDGKSAYTVSWDFDGVHVLNSSSESRVGSLGWAGAASLDRGHVISSLGWTGGYLYLLA